MQVGKFMNVAIMQRTGIRKGCMSSVLVYALTSIFPADVTGP